MPYCISCDAHFRGRGSFCSVHNPYTQGYDTQYYSDDRDTTAIKFRTGHFRTTPHHHYRKPRQITFSDSLDSLDAFNPRNALTRYNTQNQIVHSGGGGAAAAAPGAVLYDEWAAANDYYEQPYSAHSANFLRPLTTTFNHLANTHAIASLAYEVSPAGARRVTATANLDREQCVVCYSYFPDRQRLDAHRWEFPVGCDQHRVCMREEDVSWHAQSERHARCFVKGCGAVYRREGGWKASVVKEHVQGWHV